MGAYSSADQSRKTRQQKDIEYLGDRMPFGDSELLQVYRVYQQLQLQLQQRSHDSTTGDDRGDAEGEHMDESKKPTSFLRDVGVLSAAEGRKMERRSKSKSTTTSTGPADEERRRAKETAFLEERLCLLEAIERTILPEGFGNTLYRTCFLRPQDTSEYDEDDDENHPAGSSSVNDVQDNDDNEDEFARISKLEAFFAGLANGTRRDRKTVTRCLIRCCKAHPPPVDDGGDDAAAASPTYDFAYGGASGTAAFGSTPTMSKNEAVYVDPMELVDIGYRVCLAAAFLKEATGGNTEGNEDDEDVGRFLPPTDPKTLSPGLKALSNSLASLATKRKQRRLRSTTPSDYLAELVDEEDVLEWVEQVAPMYGSVLPTFLHAIFFPNRAAPPTRSSFDYPRISQESTVFPTNSTPLLFSFGCMSPSLGGEFYRLYTSASDGLSFNRLQNALLGYGGPTLLIIQSGKSTFGAFTASPWKESKDFYGNHDCFLYRLLPEITAVYRPTGGTTTSSTRFMYCNSFARSRGFDRQAHGIGFGGSTDRPRLFLAESFDDCRAGSDDLTFQKGPLLASRSGDASGGGAANATANSMFEIDNLEVWGVGGTEVVRVSLAARSRSRDIRQANINKARKVDKAAFLDDLRSGVIDNKAFAHREQIQGRDGTCELLGDDN